MLLLRAGRVARVQPFVPATSVAALLQTGPRTLFTAQPQHDGPVHDSGEPAVHGAEAWARSQPGDEQDCTTSERWAGGAPTAAAAVPAGPGPTSGGRVTVDPITLPDVMDELPPEDGALDDALRQLDLGPPAAGLSRDAARQARRAATAQLAAQRTSAEVLTRLRAEVSMPGLVLQDGEHGIGEEGLSRAAWEVLLRLRAGGACPR